MTNVSQVLAAVRRSLSQPEIARRTGIHQSKLSRWEAGNVAAGADDALKLLALAKEIGAEVKTEPTTQGA